jgi:hypothetical protein
MMQTATAVGANITASFQGVGGILPYSYSVFPGGAGGSIDASTGVYTAPATIASSPTDAYDVVTVTDAVNAKVSSQILVGTPLMLFCEIVQRQMGLANGRVYVWDQKINMPTDSGLWIVVSVARCKPFGNVNRFVDDGGAGQSQQYVSMNALLDIDLISRGTGARDRKEEFLMAVNSNYAQYQQDANSFYIGKLPAGSSFINLSELDGDAIPYRFRISLALMYAVSKQANAPYYDNNFIFTTATNA